MLIAILNDTHAGVKNGSELFLDYVEKFYSKVFFPYCKANNIKRVIHAGDYFDHRKYLNYRVLERDKTMFIDRLIEHEMEMDIIPGNHDVYWKNTNELCGMEQILGKYPFIHIHMSPTVKHYDGFPIALLPWITADNSEEAYKFIDSAPAPVLIGHLELAGFPVIAGMQSFNSHGLDYKRFSRYEMVLSGHYHTASQRDNIRYLGTQFEITWSDLNDPKHFHVYDTETRILSRVRNPFKLYYRVTYDDSGDSVILPAEIKNVTGAYVKVLVLKKEDPATFDEFINTIQDLKPHDIKIIETLDEFCGDNVSDVDSISIDDTSKLTEMYIDNVETSLDKSKIKQVINSLYVEAMNANNE